MHLDFCEHGYVNHENEEAFQKKKRTDLKKIFRGDTGKVERGDIVESKKKRYGEDQTRS